MTDTREQHQHDLDPYTARLDHTHFKVTNDQHTQFLSLRLTEKKGRPPQTVCVLGKTKAVTFCYECSTPMESEQLTYHKYITAALQSGKRVIVYIIEPK